jgi:TonB family protein
MNFKQIQILKSFIIAFLLILLTFNNTFSQNLSFKDLVNLQKEKQKNIAKFFNEKSWIKDAKTKNKWRLINPKFADSTEAIFTLQDENFDQNIVNYIISDPIIFNTLKDDFLNLADQKTKTHSIGTNIEDYVFKNLNVRFFKTRDVNNLKFYAIWIFSINDNKYFKKLDKFCIDLLNMNVNVNTSKTEAEFPGGSKEMIKFIVKNMEYPYTAHEKGIEGTVYVGFCIEADGKITDIKILKGLEGGFNEEVIRLIKLMPNWKAATLDGKPVRIQYSMPIKFSLTE